jgi:predicted TIM-barrel fold metal-dependent hydrolase
MRYLAALAGVLVGASAALAAEEPPPIIDMHMHTHHPAEFPGGAPALCRPDPCDGRGSATATSEESLRKALEQMRRHNIVKAFVSGPDLRELERWLAAAPDRFMGGLFLVKPGDPSPELMRRAHAAGHLQGMGEIAAQLAGIGPDDPSLAPYFALAAELDLPVLIHTEGIGPRLPGFRSGKGHPLLLEEVLVRHPRLRIYVENSGYPFLSEMVAMMNQYPQLYGDLSTITWLLPRPAFYSYLRGLLDAGLGKRVMFGTDQMRWPDAIGWAVAAIEEAPFLTPEQKRDIFYNNAARFLKLSSLPKARVVGRLAPGTRIALQSVP